MTTRRAGLMVVVAGALVIAFALPAMAAANGLTPIEDLGKSIFFDESLSINQNQSCATCHDPAWGWTGPDSALNAAGAVYEGSILGRFGNRKPPSSAYATLAPIFYVDKSGLFQGGNFWDGRATGERLGNPAADQAQGPFLNPVEQGLGDAACVVYRVTTGPYAADFFAVWGSAAASIAWPSNIEVLCATEGAIVPLSDADRALAFEAYDQIALSIAAYEASPESNAFTSKFDAWKAGEASLTKEEQKGFAVFVGKGKCGKCHIARGQGGTPALFTDFTFDNLGLPRNPENPWYTMPPVFNPAGLDWVDYGLGGFLASRADYASFAPENDGKHKVPTLRNVDLRPCGRRRQGLRTQRLLQVARADRALLQHARRTGRRMGRRYGIRALACTRGRGERQHGRARRSRSHSRGRIGAGGLHEDAERRMGARTVGVVLAPTVIPTQSSPGRREGGRGCA